MSTVQLFAVYRLSNLLKIRVIIYSNIMVLKLKYHSGYTYEYFPSFVLHLMTFHGFCFFVLVVYHEKLGNSCSLRESRGGQDLHLLSLPKQCPLLDFLPSQCMWATEHKKTDVQNHLSCKHSTNKLSCTGIYGMKPVFMMNYRARFLKR